MNNAIIHAIILDKKPFRENDSLLTLYSREFGKSVFVARGTKKLNSKLSGHLEPLNLSELKIIKGRNYSYISSAVNVASFLNIKKDYEKLVLAGRVLSFFKNALKENLADLKFYNLLLDYLNFLNLASIKIKNIDFLYNFFVFKFYLNAGVLPNFEVCSLCGVKIKQRFYFNFSESLLLCEKCFLKHKNEKSVVFSFDEDLREILNFSFADNYVFLKDNPINKDALLRFNGFVNKIILSQKS